MLTNLKESLIVASDRSTKMPRYTYHFSRNVCSFFSFNICFILYLFSSFFFFFKMLSLSFVRFNHAVSCWVWFAAAYWLAVTVFPWQTDLHSLYMHTTNIFQWKLFSFTQNQCRVKKKKTTHSKSSCATRRRKKEIIMNI